MVKSPTWQLARVYIYTLPFANLDMILGNAYLQGFAAVLGRLMIFVRNRKFKRSFWCNQQNDE